MIFDTDVLIWFLLGNPRAARLLEEDAAPAVSIVSVMELFQGARSRMELRGIREFLHENNFHVVPINESISHLAATLVEEHTLKEGLQVADALIAATARDRAAVLVTGNVRHMRPIPALSLKAFHPHP